MQGAEQRLQEKMQDTGVERSEQAVRDRIDDQCIVPTPEAREAADRRPVHRPHAGGAGSGGNATSS
jgi:hypothetical protein